MVLSSISSALDLAKLVTEVLAIFGIVIGYIIAARKRVKSKQEEKQADEEKRKQEREEIIKKFEELKEEIRVISNRQRINETDRLRESILGFGEKLRVNKVERLYDINLNSFMVVFAEYKKYKELGGNGYIDLEMRFIEEEFSQLHYNEEV